MRELMDALAPTPLAVAQVQYSLLDRRPETDGMVELCLERGTRLVRYALGSARLHAHTQPQSDAYAHSCNHPSDH